MSTKELITYDPDMSKISLDSIQEVISSDFSPRLKEFGKSEWDKHLKQIAEELTIEIGGEWKVYAFKPDSYSPSIAYEHHNHCIVRMADKDSGFQKDFLVAQTKKAKSRIGSLCSL